MPKLGLTMKTGKVSKWFKEQGAAVVRGEEVLEVETDKITNKVEASEDGILFQIVVPKGAEAPVGAVLGVIAAPGETPELLPTDGTASAAEAAPAAPAAKESKASPAATPGAQAPASPVARRLAKEFGIDLGQVRGSGPGGRITEKDVTEARDALANIKITPLAAVLAQQAGLDIRTLTGTGERGKITRADVERALNPEAACAAPAPTAAAAPAGGDVIPMAGMRLAIAENMSMSLQSTAQLTLMTEVDVTRCRAMLADLRAARARDASFRVSLNDVLVLLVARALRRFPRMNATCDGENIHLHEVVNMGVAVALPEGLIVPVLRNAHAKGLEQIAREVRELAGRARAGTLEPDDVTGGTFTITNMGHTVVDMFTPILKPGETGILGVGRVVEKPVAENGAVVIRPILGLSLTFDHRVLDGAPAGEFLGAVCELLRDPALAIF